MSSHPGKSYPTFILKISEEPIYANTVKEKLFGYVIEAPRGPINEPTYIASNEEALQVFGVDFAPHFYQRSNGLIITRVGIPNAKEASITYYKTGNKKCFEVEAVDKGESDIVVKVTESLGLSGGYQLTVTIPNVTSRTFSSLPTAEAIVKTINNRFAKYLKATLLEAEAEGEKLDLSGFTTTTYELQDGSFGYLFKDEKKEYTVDFVAATEHSGYYRAFDSNTDDEDQKVKYINTLSLEDKQKLYASTQEGKYDKNIRKEIQAVKTLWSSSDDEYDPAKHSVEEITGVSPSGIYVKITEKHNNLYHFTSYADSTGTTVYATGSVKLTGKTVGDYLEVIVLSNSVDGFEGNKYYIDNQATVGDTIYELYEAVYTTFYLPKTTETFTDDFVPLNDIPLTSYKLFSNLEEEYDEKTNNGTTTYVVKTDISSTAKVIYKYAFDLMRNEDVVGVAALSELQVVQATLKDHINECVEEETAILRFGITGYTQYDNPYLEKKFTTADISRPAEEMNSEYIIYIGQGAIFKKVDLTEDRGYKLLRLNPIQAIMLYTGIRSSLSYDEAIFGGEDKKILRGVTDVLPITPNQTLYKIDREELNENGVTTFKKEYDRITFLEGVTTSQDSDVLSHENIMSIVIYVTKRLITIAKSYQGKKLTEDLKETLKTALSAELQSIQQTDGSLVAIKEYNIPPYDVEVESAAMVRFNEEGQLIRESKVVARVKIVPVGALRDVELGVIVI